MKDLRLTLLSDIIGSDGVHNNKYSTSFNNLKAVISLERQDKKDKLPEKLFNNFNQLSIKKDNLNKKYSNIPLLILEQYFLRNSNQLDQEIYIEYNNKNISVKVTELYILLEDYFFEMYLLAVKIADFYNFEIKLKRNTENKNEYL